jgi:hypothetical protein
MHKIVTETRQNLESPFRSEDPLYRDDTRISSFIDMCKSKGIITGHTTVISEDGLSQTNTFETATPSLLDALREFYFPGNQYFLEEWADTTGNLVVETPPFNPNLAEDDYTIFSEFVREFEI